jgi:hypothetical protein
MQALLLAAMREGGADATRDPVVVGLGEVAADLLRLQREANLERVGAL